MHYSSHFYCISIHCTFHSTSFDIISHQTKKQAMKFPSTLSSPAKSHGRGLGKAKGGKGGIAQRIPWSEDEEDALRRAENRHGREWAEMLRDPEFAAIVRSLLLITAITATITITAHYLLTTHYSLLTAYCLLLYDYNPFLFPFILLPFHSSSCLSPPYNPFPPLPSPPPPPHAVPRAHEYQPEGQVAQPAEGGRTGQERRRIRD